MFPASALLNLADVGLGAVEPCGQDSERFVRGSNFQHLRFSQFTGAVDFHHSVAPGVLYVRLTSKVFQVSDMVVRLVSVFVVHLKPRWARAEESTCNEAVNRWGGVSVSVREVHGWVSVPVNLVVEYATYVRDAVRTFTAYATSIRDAVDFFPSPNGKPHFIHSTIIREEG